MKLHSHADALVILLHGVGSNGQDMMVLADAWRPSLPGVVFVGPDAPFAFEGGHGTTMVQHRRGDGSEPFPAN